jgi:hypothetical protein
MSVRHGGRRGATALLGAALAVWCVAGAAPARADDAFLAGYAAAVLERDFGVRRARVQVSGGSVRVETVELSAEATTRLVEQLSRVDGVQDVEVVSSADQAAAMPGDAYVWESERSSIDLFPGLPIFEPLLADPRWPRFSASFHDYFDDDEIEHVGAANFGATFPLVGGSAFGDGGWQLSLQAGVFAIFDLDAESLDLVNADYLVGLLGSYRRGPLSGFLRIYHQSSHLGDEFLLRSRIDRVNLSFEALDAVASWDVFEFLRLYGGAGWIFHREPADLDPFYVEAGTELRSPWAWRGALRPLAALDLQWREESDWRTDVSVRAGLEVQSPELRSLRLLLLLEYYNGRSPNGQFWARRIEYLGAGAHLLF